MYNKYYDDPSIRANDFNFIGYLKPHLSSNMIICDLGCGTCKKTIKISNLTTRIIACDSSQDMLNKAQENLLAANCHNIELIVGNNLSLPFHDNSFDLCTAMLTTWSPSETYRVLRPRGLFIFEALCANDKAEIKIHFGKDSMGWRGRNLNQSPAAHELQLVTSLSPYFEVTDIKKVEFNTTLTKDGFIRLLECTPTIRNFPQDTDMSIIDTLSHDGFVTFTERRLFVSAISKKEC